MKANPATSSPAFSFEKWSALTNTTPPNASFDRSRQYFPNSKSISFLSFTTEALTCSLLWALALSRLVLIGKGR